jgi:hypothetical protein
VGVAGDRVGHAGLWTWAIVETKKVMGTEDVGFAVALIVAAIIATILLPLCVGTLRLLHGPVIVGRVARGRLAGTKVNR